MNQNPQRSCQPREKTFPAKRKIALVSVALTAVALALAAGQFLVKGQQPDSKASASADPAKAPAVALFSASNAAAVVDAANAFLAMLTEQQKAVVQVDLSPANGARWSNLPAGMVQRNGIYFRDLKPEQADAALKVARVALSQEGFERFQELRAADDVLLKTHGAGRRGPGSPGNPGAPSQSVGPEGAKPPEGAASGPAGPPPGGPRGPGGGKNPFGSGNYIIAFLGKPSKTNPWMLQLGGHHIAFNLYYKGATGASTPYFLGVQPNVWKDADGTMHAPLAPMRDAMHGLLHSLSPEQLAKARLESRFSDVYVGPGKDSRFPARSEGAEVSGLSTGTKEFLKQAIAAWTGDSVQGAEYRKLYEAELEQTKVGYSGSTELSKEGDYARIDGPHLWIEFACQGNDHYHTIWRDRTTDYGAEFHF